MVVSKHDSFWHRSLKTSGDRMRTLWHRSIFFQLILLRWKKKKTVENENKLQYPWCPTSSETRLFITTGLGARWGTTCISAGRRRSRVQLLVLLKGGTCNKDLIFTLDFAVDSHFIVKCNWWAQAGYQFGFCYVLICGYVVLEMMC